jgi:hypothetical protein
MGLQLQTQPTVFTGGLSSNYFFTKDSYIVNLSALNLYSNIISTSLSSVSLTAEDIFTKTIKVSKSLSTDVNTSETAAEIIQKGSGAALTVNGTISGNNLKVSLNSSTATGNYSFAEGEDNQAIGTGSHAEGGSTIANGNYSHAEGYDTGTSGIASHSEGAHTLAVGNYSHAAGIGAAANHFNSWIWSGNSVYTPSVTNASTTRAGQFLVSAVGGVFIPGKVGMGIDSFGEGFENNTLTVQGSISSSSLYTNILSAESAYVKNFFTSSNLSLSTTELSANNIYSDNIKVLKSLIVDVSGSDPAAQIIQRGTGLALAVTGPISGLALTVTGPISGKNTKVSFNQGTANGQNSFAIGDGIANGYSSFAGGFYGYSDIVGDLVSPQADGLCSFSYGFATSASGVAAFALGQDTIATGNRSFVGGYGSRTRGALSLAFGHQCLTNADYSLTFGFQCSTGLSATYGCSIGYNNTVLGIAGHAEGYDTEVLRLAGHSEGSYTVAEGINSHAAGFRSNAKQDYTYAWTDGNLGTITQNISTTRAGQYMVSASGGMFIPGKVGINTDSLSNELTVNGSISAKTLTVTSLSADSVFITSLGNTLSINLSSYSLSAGILNVFESLVVDVSSNNTAAKIIQRGSGNALIVEDQTAPSSSPFVVTNNKVGMGTTSPTERLTVSGNISATKYYGDGSNLTSVSAVAFTVLNDTSTNANCYPLFVTAISGSPVNTSNTKLIYNPSTGTLGAMTFITLSDVTLKDNIIPLQNSIDLLDQITPVSFTWKDNGKKSYGFIAQEIEKVLPDIVDTNPDNGIKSVSYDQLIPILFNIIKELKEEINELKKK